MHDWAQVMIRFAFLGGRRKNKLLEVFLRSKVLQLRKKQMN